MILGISPKQTHNTDTHRQFIDVQNKQERFKNATLWHTKRYCFFRRQETMVVIINFYFLFPIRPITFQEIPCKSNLSSNIQCNLMQRYRIVRENFECFSLCWYFLSKHDTHIRNCIQTNGRKYHNNGNHIFALFSYMNAQD